MSNFSCYAECNHAECQVFYCYAECHTYCCIVIVKLSLAYAETHLLIIVMLSVIIAVTHFIIVMTSVVIQIVIVLIVGAPSSKAEKIHWHNNLNFGQAYSNSNFLDKS